MRILTLAITGLLSGTAAQAGGDALVIGNSSYNGVQTLFAATQVAEAAEAMRAQGFDVTEARDAGGNAMRQGFGDFVATLDDDGRTFAEVAAARGADTPDVTRMAVANEAAAAGTPEAGA